MAQLPDLLAGYLTTGQAAGALRLSAVTQNKWRAKNKGPRWCRIDTRVFYRHEDLQSWVAQEAARIQAADNDR